MVPAERAARPRRVRTAKRGRAYIGPRYGRALLVVYGFLVARVVSALSPILPTEH